MDYFLLSKDNDSFGFTRVPCRGYAGVLGSLHLCILSLGPFHLSYFAKKSDHFLRRYSKISIFIYGLYIAQYEACSQLLLLLFLILCLWAS